MSFLDIRTIVACFAFSNAVCIFLVGSLWFEHRKDSSELFLWFANFILQALSLFLIAMRGVIPDWLSIIVGNAVGVIGNVLMIIGLERYLGLKGKQIHNWIMVAVFIFIQSYFSAVLPILAVRTVNLSAALLIISAQAAWVLLHRVDPETRKTTRPVGVVYSIYVLISVIRILGTLIVKANNDFLHSGTFDAVILLVYQMMGIMLTFSLFLMVSRQMSLALEKGREKRLEAERELRLSEEKFSAAFHGIPDAIALTSKGDGTILDVNEGFLNLSEYTRDEVIGQKSIELNLWRNQSDRAKYVEMLETIGYARNIEMEFRKKSGNFFSGSVSGEIIHLQQGAYILNIIHDMTERKKLENEILHLNTDLDLRIRQRTAELEASNKELESFSYSVSHDLRAPLRSIDGFSFMLLNDYGDAIPGPGKDYLVRIRSAAQRMGHLIDSMLRLAQISRTQIHIQEVDINTLAVELYKELSRSDQGRDVQIKIEPGITVKADLQLLRIVLANLLENAWKFTSKREKALIEIGSLQDRDKGRVFFVSDNGAGFDETYRDKLFVAFQRLHGQGEFTGTGIGLATAHRAIRRHGGEIWAEGEVDRGATFYFTIPDRLLPTDSASGEIA